MSESLYDVYRPKNFKEVVGQDAVVRGLKSNIERKTGHTFLFDGPSGTGKTTLARIVAAELGARPADILEIDAATNTGVDAMREVTKTLVYRPLDGAIKVVIVDECHRLSGGAWDSLLKPLEEPPSHVYWFLCTTEVGKVPATIKTRAVRYSLKAVPVEDLIELLEDIAKLEKIHQNEEGERIIRLCAKEAGGSPRQALSNLEACLEAPSAKEAATLLKSALEVVEAVDLAKALMAGKGWSSIKVILDDLKEKELSPESVRHTIRGYMTSVILGSDKFNQSHFAVLEAFSTPFNPGDQMSPLVLACGALCNGK